MNSVIENGIVSWLLRREFLNPPVAHIGHLDEAVVGLDQESMVTITARTRSPATPFGLGVVVAASQQGQQKDGIDGFH
jgi:hypothetical protein